jgi:hypothetical protein
MQWIDYGDGTITPQTGGPAGCKAGATPTPAASTQDFQHAFAAAGTYRVTVLVQSHDCANESVTLTLPVSAS